MAQIITDVFATIVETLKTVIEFPLGVLGELSSEAL